MHNTASTLRKTTIPIEGMTCGACVDSITNVFKDKPGIGSCVVSLPKNEAYIKYDPKIIQAEDLVQTIEDAGFDVPQKELYLAQESSVSEGEITENSAPSLQAQPTPEILEPLPTKVPDKETHLEGFDASGAALSCCIASSLGDLGKVAESTSGLTSSKYSAINSYPDSSTQVGLGVATAVAGFLGACASLETFNSAAGHVKRLKEARTHISSLRKHVGESSGLEAVDLFLQRQLRKARFVKWVPGATSASASTVLGIGGVVFKASPIGLGLACVDSISHIGETSRLLQEHTANKKLLKEQLSMLKDRAGSSSDQDRMLVYDQLREITKEISTCKKRRLGAAASAVGTGLLLPVSAAAYGATAAKSPYLIGAGLASLVPGIALSLAYNPYKDLGWRREFSERIKSFSQESQNIEPSAVKTFFNDTLKTELRDKLRLSQDTQAFARKYKKAIKSDLSRIRRFSNESKRVAGTIASNALSFASSPFTLLGSAGKASREFYNSEPKERKDGPALKKGLKAFHYATSRVLRPIEKLGNVLERGSSGLKRITQDSVIASSKISRNRRFQALQDLPPELAGRNDAVNPSLFTALQSHPKIQSEVIKTFAQDALRHDGSLQKSHVAIFPQGTSADRTKIHTVLQAIHQEAKLSPCCPVKGNEITNFYETTLSEAGNAPQQAAFSNLLEKSFDKAILFGQTPASDGRFYSRFLGAYNSVEARRSKAASHIVTSSEAVNARERSKSPKMPSWCGLGR